MGEETVDLQYLKDWAGILERAAEDPTYAQYETIRERQRRQAKQLRLAIAALEQRQEA